MNTLISVLGEQGIAVVQGLDMHGVYARHETGRGVVGEGLHVHVLTGGLVLLAVPLIAQDGVH